VLQILKHSVLQMLQDHKNGVLKHSDDELANLAICICIPVFYLKY